MDEAWIVVVFWMKKKKKISQQRADNDRNRLSALYRVGFNNFRKSAHREKIVHAFF